MLNHELVHVYVAELADRALRFHIHLDAVEKEFYETSVTISSRTVPQDKPLFVDSFRRCVWKVLEIAGEIAKASKGDLSDTDKDSLMMVARHAFLCINELHERGLIHLPRPSEPVELRRFCRIISRNVLNRKAADLAVYVTETVAEGAFAADPLTDLKKNQFRRLIEMVNGLPNVEPVTVPDVEGANIIHVTIGRIDARNPVRWPTLFHEAAHKLLTAALTAGKPLDEHFSEWLPPDARLVVTKLSIDTHRWLTEIWCDLLAGLVMGPSFFFSQFAAFIATPPHDTGLLKDYPPHSFRLRLIGMFLQHRYEFVQAGPVRDRMKACLELVEYWDRFYEIDIRSNAVLKMTFDFMRGYFQEHFFSGHESEAENFQRKYESMIRYVSAIDLPNLDRMQKQLSQGLPIASKPSENSVLHEKPTSVQEVLLAAWLDRIDRLRELSLQRLSQARITNWQKELDEHILPPVDRFDEAVLRSLQSAEWLHSLGSETLELQMPEVVDVEAIRSRRPSLLADRDIIQLLSKGELRIIPLVNVDQQLGATSFDIRLGASFEVFLPACKRTPDSVSGVAYDSQRIDLDYLEHIVLLPGQFMLAHSFEYLKLPDWLAAELDGRSSYARLGLEVHMTAGMIDPGFEGVVTFELFNSGPNPIQLFPGLRIAQIRFTAVQEPLHPYSKQHTAKYRGMLQHNRSLYMNDPDFKRINDAIKEFHDRQLDSDQPPH